MKFLNSKKRYPAYTLLELLIVMSIFAIIGGMTFSAFDGLQNTVKMNEYMLNLEQDVRNVQRSSMLLEREPSEKWIYGLGIDFSEAGEDGVYKVFKWCSQFDDYGDISTKSDLPSYDPSAPLGSIMTFGVNGTLPTELTLSNTCGSEVTDNTILRTVAGYDRTITLPKSTIVLGEAKYILFESVSGRAFFYDSDGNLLNYTSEGEMLDESLIVNFDIEITPLGQGSTRKLSVRNLSGKIDTYVYE